MVPLSLFRSRELSAATAVGCLMNLGFYGQLFVFTLYLQQVRGDSAPRLPGWRGARRWRSKNDPAPSAAERRLRGSRVARFLGLAQLAQVGCKVIGRDEGVGVVVTQHPAAGQGVLVECAGLLILVQLTQTGCEPAGRGEGFLGGRRLAPGGCG